MCERCNDITDIDWKWSTSHVYMRLVTRMNEACHTHQWGMSHAWMRHVKLMNEYTTSKKRRANPPSICGSRVLLVKQTRHTHLWIRHITLTCESDMSHVWMHQTCHTYECVIQGGEDSSDVFSCRLFFAKEPLIIGLFRGKWPLKIRHPMTLRHPVLHIWTRHVTHMKSSCHTNEWVMSHV